ncbi:MAG: bifunctional heptose 7-phosphate kinase/heptose 1-phosphate adenyltransferase [Sediminibacterium sp.]|jgi:rfaE bifunctional protein kinase chain/domain
MLEEKAFKDLFEGFNHTKIGVIGDIMLDTYWWGNVDRISPEAPVPIVNLKRKEIRVGGAANVALNLRALGAPTTVFAVIGNDLEGADLKGLLEAEGIQTKYIHASADRVTTNKVRVMGRNQQMMRLDHEHTNDINAAEEAQLFKNFCAFVEAEKPSLIILEDYNKGVLTASLIQSVIDFCNQKGIPTAVDPKQKNFLAFKGCTLFKPNLKEVKEGLKIEIPQINAAELLKVHNALHAQMTNAISFITLSEHGVFIAGNNDHKLIPTHIRNIADVSGAGDTVIAVASLVYAASKDMVLAAEMANIAGGLVCELVGTAPIDKAVLAAEVNKLLVS